MTLALYLLWLWQPERQVRLHTAHFLGKVERRNWEAAARFMAADYRDRWWHDRATALAEAREAFRQFLFVTLEVRTDSCELAPESATTRTVLRVSGQGGPVAQLVMERVNTLREPFVFAWRKAGWPPWAWELTSVDHPELNVDRVSF